MGSFGHRHTHRQAYSRVRMLYNYSLFQTNQSPLDLNYVLTLEICSVSGYFENFPLRNDLLPTTFFYGPSLVCDPCRDCRHRCHCQDCLARAILDCFYRSSCHHHTGVRFEILQFPRKYLVLYLALEKFVHCMDLHFR